MRLSMYRYLNYIQPLRKIVKVASPPASDDRTDAQRKRRAAVTSSRMMKTTTSKRTIYSHTEKHAKISGRLASPKYLRS